ncbi:MAG: alkylhydroperoxidase-related (seleno)protein [Candidatus Binatia bacterium]
MNLYEDSQLPIRDALVRAHADTLMSFATPGHWFSGSERRAIVAEAREARREAGLQETGSSEEFPYEGDLSAPVKRVARQVAVFTNDLERSFFEQALAEGLSDAEYVEVVGVVSRAVNVDIFARGIGVPIRALPAPLEGESSRIRPRTARNEGAWVETVPGGLRGEEEAKLLYGSSDPQAAPFIYRALSLVPMEAAGLMKLGSAQYLGISSFMDLQFTYEPTLSRPQYELVAARVSALNECFY